jgi:hypothetical protein
MLLTYAQDRDLIRIQANLIIQSFKQPHKPYYKESIPKKNEIAWHRNLKSFLDQLLQFLDAT